MYTPPKNPTPLCPNGTRIALPKPTLLNDTREQQPYTFAPFHRWFADIRIATLKTGDYSIAGFEDTFAIERKSKEDLYHALSFARDKAVRQNFLEEIQRFQTFRDKLVLVEASLSEILTGFDFSQLHGNAVVGTLQAAFTAYGVPVLYADNRALAPAMAHPPKKARSARASPRSVAVNPPRHIERVPDIHARRNLSPTSAVMGGKLS